MYDVPRSESSCPWTYLSRIQSFMHKDNIPYAVTQNVLSEAVEVVIVW